MSHRAHLFSLRLGDALRQACFKEPYGASQFKQDLIAGITVGIIAIPLAMALAIASGVPPQYGLYTVVVAGFLIALCGGSRLSISGPTAAFVVILYPIAHKYGLGGLLVATVMAGVLLVAMALARLGRLIEYIPEPVVLGFTGGIAIVIATLQIKDFLGLTLLQVPEHYLAKISVLAQSLNSVHWPSVAVAVISFLVLLVWPKLKTPLPPHLPALLIGSLVAWGLNNAGLAVDTVHSRFSYDLADGTRGQGIPGIVPSFLLPWQQPGANGARLIMSWQLIKELLPAAFAIALLGAIESLLCAVVLDTMTGKRHSANSELLGQGVGNIVAPFFGGITATAAIARSAANYRAGAQSPIAGMVHASVVLLGLLALAPILGYLPMPAMAALLIMVAWNMSEAGKAKHLWAHSGASDRWVFACCFFLTIFFDMVVAISVGMVLAAVLFMKDMAATTRLIAGCNTPSVTGASPSKNGQVFSVEGPLFFAAADRIFSELTVHCHPHTSVIIDLARVPLLDAGGVTALFKWMDFCQQQDITFSLRNPPPQVHKVLTKSGIHTTCDTSSEQSHFS